MLLNLDTGDMTGNSSGSEMKLHKALMFLAKLLLGLFALLLLIIILLCWHVFIRQEPGEQRHPAEMDCVLLIGGNVDSGAWQVEYYHPTKAECNWVKVIEPLPSGVTDSEALSGCYLAASRQIVFRDDHDYKAYSLATGITTKIDDKNLHDGSTMTAVSKTRCLACGGSITPNCYRIDADHISEVTPIADMPLKLIDAASVSLGLDDFYVVGGKAHKMISGAQKKVFRFHHTIGHINDGNWEEQIEMTKRRYRHSATALSATEFIVCGGYEETNSHWLQIRTTSDCEIFTAQGSEKGWRTAGKLNVARRRFALVTFDGEVYAIGGKGIDGRNLVSVERYDRPNDKWEMWKPLKHARSGFLPVAL